MVFIMPGIDSAAPERTETSSGSAGSPNFLPPNAASTFLTASSICGNRGFGDLLALLVVGGADFGRDGEARRDGDADQAHLGEVGPLAAEQFLLLAVAVGRLAAEEVDVLRTHFRPSCVGSIMPR